MYPLSETHYCPCNKYNAQPVGNWSDCVLPEGGRLEVQLGMKVQGDVKECGQGYRYQAMACYNQDNQIVETSRCNSHGLSPFSLLLFSGHESPPPVSQTQFKVLMVSTVLVGLRLISFDLLNEDLL